jgi:hypothetical protein
VTNETDDQRRAQLVRMAVDEQLTGTPKLLPYQREALGALENGGKLTISSRSHKGFHPDAYKAVAEAIAGASTVIIDPFQSMIAPKGTSFVGVDFAEGKDHTAIAVCEGRHVVLVAGETVTVDKEWLNDWSARRKHDREVLALVFETIARNRGAEVERSEGAINPGYHGQSIDFQFTLNGVGVLLDIDDLHGGDHALLHWYNTGYISRNFTTRFCVNIGASTSGRPHHKATSTPADWYSLAMMLDAGLMMADRGEAFEASAT